jgi:hypothetical protein
MYQTPATPSVKAVICPKVRPVPKILQAVCKGLTPPNTRSLSI